MALSVGIWDWVAEVCASKKLPYLEPCRFGLNDFGHLNKTTYTRIILLQFKTLTIFCSDV